MSVVPDKPAASSGKAVSGHDSWSFYSNTDSPVRNIQVLVCNSTMTSPFLTQTYTPVAFAAHPAKQNLVHAFRGKPLDALRTPAVIIDRAIFAKNCAQMHDNARAWGAGFRAHVKTHKVCIVLLYRQSNRNPCIHLRHPKVPDCS